MFKYLKLPAEHPAAMDRETMRKALFDEGLLLPGSAADVETRDNAVPTIRVGPPIFELLPFAAGLPVATYTEVHDTVAVKKYVAGCRQRVQRCNGVGAPGCWHQAVEERRAQRQTKSSNKGQDRGAREAASQVIGN